MTGLNYARTNASTNDIRRKCEIGGYVVNYACRVKRGCFFCQDAKSVYWSALTNEEHSFARAPIGKREEGSSRFIICPYAECPYHELDKYQTYKDYERDEKNNVVNIRGFFRFLTGG